MWLWQMLIEDLEGIRSFLKLKDKEIVGMLTEDKRGSKNCPLDAVYRAIGEKRMALLRKELNRQISVEGAMSTFSCSFQPYAKEVARKWRRDYEWSIFKLYNRFCLWMAVRHFRRKAKRGDGIC